jgi:hypothetical protein
MIRKLEKKKKKIRLPAVANGKGSFAQYVVIVLVNDKTAIAIQLRLIYHLHCISL